MCQIVQFQKKIHTHPMEGHWEFLGRGRVLRAKILEAMYEDKPEFPGGRRGGGVQNKKPFMGGVWIFSGTVHYVTMGKIGTIYI